MCGIVGAYTFQHSTFSITPHYIATMRETMAHRGPDGVGIYVSPDERIGLGQRRLAIIDLSATADQPMSNEDDSVWIVYNGEIYNHRVIRAELEALGGHRWKTDHSDTEMLIHAYEQWGVDFLHRLRGMFAIAIWDAGKRELFLARDRIGIKPLYYSLHHGRITFASEIKALLLDPDQPRTVNEEGLFHYLSFMTTPAPMTLFEGIHKLEAGTWLLARDDGTIRQERYWDVWDHTQPLTGVDENEIAERLIAELRESVHLHKESDVPVGVFLSGGIDSSTNTALFTETEDSGGVKTFSIGYTGDYASYKNEVDYARRMAQFAGADYYERLLSQDDVIDFIPRMVQLQDEPIADPVCVPVYYVSKLARDNGIKVCQVGEGSDELFFGYPWWQRALQERPLVGASIPRPLRSLALIGARWLGKDASLRYEWLRRSLIGQPTFWGGADVFTDTLKSHVLSPALRARFKGFSSWAAIEPIYQRFQSQAWEKTDLNWMSYIDLRLRLPELLLMRVDKMAMGVSLEGRVPFLDHKVVELAMSIPSAIKTRDHTLKYILKKAVRGVIPDEFIDRPKQGFGVPIQELFFDRLGENMRREVHNFARETNFLDAAYINHLFDRQLSQHTWLLYNFALWWREYIAGSPRPAAAPEMAAAGQ
jgi:asparagine synthase (glutamine-hydrolysing)